MKRQLDRLKGKRLVTGDPNLMTKDEICINATPNGVEVKEIGTDGKIKDLAGSGGGGDSEEKEWYYKIDWDKLLQGYGNGTTDQNILEILLMIPLGMSYSAIYPYDLGNTTSAYYDVDLPSPLLYAELMKNPENLVPNLAKIKAMSIKYDYSYPVMMDNITIIHGDIYTKAYYSINQVISIDELKPIIDEYYTEISKQEYEPLIERQNVILGKE